MKVELENIKKYLEALRDSANACVELDELADNIGIDIKMMLVLMNPSTI